MNTSDFSCGMAHESVITIIRVDRSVRPSYPEWVKTAMHPELENTGPAEYDVSSLEQWLHDDQKDGKWTKGNKLYEHLKETDMLKNCLGLRDLEEIQKKGSVFFRKYFKGKDVFGWAGIVQRHNGSLEVPYLCQRGDRVLFLWHLTGDDWYVDSPALRLESSPKA